MPESKALNLLRVALILGATSANSCDVSSQPEGRIVDGLAAHLGQFPFMAGLEITKPSGKTFCGGSLILAEWILTAAHCLHTAEFVHVYLGATYRNEPEIGYAIWHTDFFIHPSCNLQERTHDIALIRIPATDFCEKIRPITLPTINSPTNYVGEIAIVSGWGQTCSHNNLLSKCLQWTKVQIISNEVCEKIDPFVHSSNMCLSVEIQGFPWNGDSGGPVFLESTGELIGVFSRSIVRVAEERKPLIATHVVDFLPWIKTVTGSAY